MGVSADGAVFLGYSHQKWCYIFYCPLTRLSMREMDFLSFFSSTGFCRFFSQILSRKKRIVKPCSSLTLAVKKDSK